MKVSPVKQLALSYELPHDHVPPAGMSDYALPAEFPMSDKSILLTCSFGHMIPDSLLDTFANPWQRINIHPSLLPQLRGAAPIQWALARRLKESGVSIQTLEKGKFDTGTIVAREAFAFPPVVESAEGIPSFLQVEKVMADRAAELLVRILSDLPGHWANSRPQNESQKTFAPKAKAAFSKIKWDKMTAEDVVATERAFAYLYPLSTTLHPHAASFKPVAVNFFDTSTLLSIQIDLETAEVLLADSLPAGSAAFSPALNALVVKTLPEGQGAVLLVVKSIKTEGKKAKNAAEWFKAYRDRADPSTAILTFQ